MTTKQLQKAADRVSALHKRSLPLLKLYKKAKTDAEKLKYWRQYERLDDQIVRIVDKVIASRNTTRSQHAKARVQGKR